MIKQLLQSIFSRTGIHVIKRTKYKGRTKFHVNNFHYDVVVPSANYAPWLGDKEFLDTYTEIKAIIVDLLGADESKITMEARFREELEADSLDLVELIMAFEDKFGAEISDEDAQKILTVGEAVRYIDSHK